MTQAERREPAIPLPETFICIMNDGGGNLFCFDSTIVARGDGQAPILLWNHELEEDQIPELIADSFSDWLESLLTE